VERDFSATRPNQLWVADLTYVASLVRLRVRGLGHRRLQPLPGRLAGLAVAAHRPGLDALEMAIWRRQASWTAWCITRTGAVQYLSIRYTERLAEAGAVTSVGSRGDSYDNALAETIIGCTRPS
jgi:putative transposase